MQFSPAYAVKMPVFGSYFQEWLRKVVTSSTVVPATEDRIYNLKLHLNYVPEYWLLKTDSESVYISMDVSID